MSTFFGIELGRRVLSAFTYAMDISSHNVANAQTEGYHKQGPVFTSTDPYPLPGFNREIGPFQLGSGVKVSEVKRFVDNSLEQRLSGLQPEQQYQDITAQYLGELESTNILKNGILPNVNDFFASWQNVANAPEDITQRGVLIQKAVALSDQISSFSSSIIQERSDVNSAVVQGVSDVNALLTKIKDLNSLIRKVVAGGDTANDLTDQREQALTELSKLVDFQQVNGNLGAINVYIGGRVVVQDDQVTTLVGTQDPANSNYVSIKFADAPLLTDPSVDITKGKLKALLDVRDSATSGLMYYKNEIDTFATQFINKVNQQQAAGFDLNGAGGYVGVWPPAVPAVGDLFFNDVVAAEPALNMKVNADFLDALNGPARVRAATTVAGVPGDGSNALTIAQLSTFPFIIGTFTPAAFITNMYSTLGTQVQSANSKKSATDDLIQQITAMRDSVSSVSMDEEAANMVEYQKSYQAGAQIISYYNQMFTVLFNMVGTTGAA